MSGAARTSKAFLLDAPKRVQHAHAGNHTKRAAMTDSSHKSSRNSSRATDSLSTVMTRWHSWGRKNSMSSYGNWRSLRHST